ncbi:asparaginase [Ahrensia sp. R2A130]|uniref:asparaginase n=1 Tax=Ahrensia sp. R2A130 TaxID=744979 RepID=UPI0001E09C01|nr:asparaginase [Ahrensia sp. R2A130]EFL90032.1 L-asparaginase II [Ahrensia sp. R2A130]
MANPILVEITRGDRVESVHRGAVSVVDGDGNTVWQTGDTQSPVFPRSAVKAIQALPLVESGTADALGFTDEMLALACSSHSGEPGHIETATAMLAKAGLDEAALECGGHWSSQQPVLIEQARTYADTPTAICNNCSGKHAGFVCTAAHTGVDPTGYISPDHAIMTNVRRAMEEMTNAEHSITADCGTDGCSIPTHAIPLDAMALGFARMATGKGLSNDRANAAKRLMNACMANPWHVAGTDRFCTSFMTTGAGRLFAKTGAEGVFCGAIPELGYGIALKCDDGGTRGAEAMMAAVTAKLLGDTDPLYETLHNLGHTTMRNWNGIVAGEIRPSAGAFA